MNRLTLLLLAMAGLLCVAQSVGGKEVFTWTDKNGVVHYVDTPPDNPDARSMEAPEAYRPGSVGIQPAETEAPEADAGVEGATEETPSAAEAIRQQLAESRVQRRAEAAERERICLEARRQLALVEPSRRVFYENEQGETERLDDEERVRMVEVYKQQIEENCR